MRFFWLYTFIYSYCIAVRLYSTVVPLYCIADYSYSTVVQWLFLTKFVFIFLFHYIYK